MSSRVRKTGISTATVTESLTSMNRCIRGHGRLEFGGKLGGAMRGGLKKLMREVMLELGKVRRDWREGTHWYTCSVCRRLRRLPFLTVRLQPQSGQTGFWGVVA